MSDENSVRDLLHAARKASKPADEALRESEQRLRLATEAAGMFIWEYDFAVRKISWSDNAAKVIGCRADELSPDIENSFFFVHPEDADRVREKLAQTVESRQEFSQSEFRGAPHYGTSKHYFAHVRIQYDADGSPARAFGVTQDVSERKHAEEALLESETTFRAMFSVSSVGMAQADSTTGRFVRVNAAMCTMTGYTEDELVGLTIDDITHPDDHGRDREERRRINSGEVQGYEIEKRYRRKDGSEVWVHVTVNAVRDKRGRAVRNTAVIQDITERKRADEALRESEAQLRLVAETLPVFILRVDTDLRYQFVNRAYAQRFGMEPQELIGKRLPEVIGQKAYEAAKPYLDRMLAGEEVQYETTVPYEKLGPRFMRSANVLDLDESGRLRSVIGVLVDLTDRKRAEDALKEADRRKDEFLATLAHELRNPLAPIRNAAQIIKAKLPPDPDLALSRDIIERQVRQMARLLDDLLDVSRITRNRLELRKRPVSLTSVIESAIETSAPLIEAAGHRFTCELPGEPVYLDGDPVRLAQLFANLLNNAAKYTPDGGRMTLRAERRDQELIVSVKDNGIGFAPDMQARLFEMFSQDKPALERAQGGLGIGLALVKGLVELHGGRVEARSEGTGKGSEFIVHLPVARPQVGIGAGSGGARTSPVQRRRILIADDLKDTADTLSMLLRETGHDVQTTYDGEQAVEAAERYRPEVVVLDLGMPKLNGLDACRMIRALPWGRSILMVALTGWGQEEDRRRSREAGFDAHLVKPVDASVLTTLIASASGGMGSESASR
jgi:PAS domain S-box-containing protein